MTSSSAATSPPRDFLRKGVFSCYLPVDPALPVPDDPLHLSPSDWKSLIHLAHANKAEAFRRYADHYLSTAGQIYWSDTHQLSLYLDGYHEELERKLGSTHRGSEMITELYVPRRRLRALMSDARDDFRRTNVNVIYGTVRLIEQDDESFLAWAREPWACIVFNLHVDHTPRGIRHASAAFRRLIDLAVGHGGSYYLTYHKFATREQVEACYPRFREFLRRKRRYDPEERFQSDWYVHYRDQFLATTREKPFQRYRRISSLDRTSLVKGSYEP